MRLKRKGQHIVPTGESCCLRTGCKYLLRHRADSRCRFASRCWSKHSRVFHSHLQASTRTCSLSVSASVETTMMHRTGTQVHFPAVRVWQVQLSRMRNLYSHFTTVIAEDRLWVCRHRHGQFCVLANQPWTSASAQGRRRTAHAKRLMAWNGLTSNRHTSTESKGVLFGGDLSV